MTLMVLSDNEKNGRKGIMENKAVATERRRHPRFLVKERASAAVVGDEVGLPYHLIDISESGMAFRYLHTSPLPLSDSQMDIYLDEDLYIGRVPVTVVDDRQLVSDAIPTRHCGVRFGKLTPAQQIQLQAFIRSQTQSVQ